MSLNTMKAVLNPAVTETRTVVLSPATVTVTMSLREAALVKALIGRTGGTLGLELYNKLVELGTALPMADRSALPFPPSGLNADLIIPEVK